MALQLELLRSEFYSGRGESAEAEKALQAAEEVYASTGLPRETDWLVIGPFDNPDNAGLTIEYPPEKRIDLSASYPGKSGYVKWQKANDNQIDGQLDFTRLFTPYEWAIAYAYVEVLSPQDRDVRLRIGSDDGVKVWLNDEVVWTNQTARGIQLDQDTVPARLQSGKNRLLFKVDQGRAGWGLILRITDETGLPVKELRYLSPVAPL